MPTSHISFTVTDNGALLPAAPFAHDENPLDTAVIFVPSLDPPSKAKPPVLEVLREEQENEQENELAENFSELSTPSPLDSPKSGSPTPPALRSAPPVPAPHDYPPVMRRPRNMSCPDPQNRNGLVFTHRPVRPDSMASLHSVLRSPMSAASSDLWEDTEDGFSSQSDSEYAQAARPRAGSVLGVGSPSRPATTYSAFSTLSDGALDDLDLGAGFGMDEILDSGFTHEEEAKRAGRTHHSRASIATMNSVMTGTSVDAVLPRHGAAMPLPPRPVSPTPSTAASESTEEASVRTSVVDLSRYKSSHQYKISLALPDSPVSPTDNKWYDTEESHDEDVIDSYFYGE